MRPAFSCLVLGLAALGACSKPAADSAAKSAPAAARPAVATPGLFARPHPKAGLWKTTMSTDAGPGLRMSGEICLDASTEDSAFANRPKNMKADCAKTSFGPNPGGGVAFSTTCTANGRKITTRGVASGDFDSAYTVDVTTTMDPPPAGVAPDVSSRIEARWMGPCKPGQKPGQASMKFGGLGRG